MGKKRITIKDIAKELNISTSTVSRALSDKWDVNPKTKKTVLELAEKWNYTPNPISLSLKQNETKFIGVIIPEFINSFFPEVIIGIESILIPKGYKILISQSNESSENELNNLKALEKQMVDGFIISLTKETTDISYFQRMIAKNIPIVFFNRVKEEILVPKVIIDDYKCAFMAVEHLIKQGKRRIVHLAGNENLQLAIKRKSGYVDALAKHGIDYDENLTILSGLTIKEGIEAAYKVLRMNVMPDAIFAINDPVAIGAMKTLQKHGIKIPEDIAIVGFTDSKMAQIIEPNLTSVEQPTIEMGQVAAELLLEQIKNIGKKEISSKTVVLDAKLNIRGSSCIHKNHT